MKRYSVCVYPYDGEFAPVLEHACLISEEYEICALVSPRGWGLNHQCVTLNRGGGEAFLTIQASFSGVEAVFNTVLVPEFTVSEQFTDTVINNVIKTLPRTHEIIWCKKLNSVQEERLEAACSEAGCKLDYKLRQEWPDDELIASDDLANDELAEFAVPIVAVSGSWENTDKFKISLALRENLLSKGYKVSQIGSRNYCELMGFHSFPAFMYNPEIGETEKVMLFNRFVKRIIDKEDPEMLIVTMPGSVGSYNAKFTNGFGILPYLAFKAISVDFHIFSVFYKHMVNKYLGIMSDSCKYKFDSPADCFHMSNMFIDMAASYEKKKPVMNIVPRYMVDEALLNNEETPIVPIMNLFQEQAVENLIGLILRKLSDDSVKIMV